MRKLERERKTGTGVVRKIKRKRKTVGGVYSDKIKEKKKYRDRQRAEHMPRKRK